MLKIRKFTCENLEKNIITDKAAPTFSFSVDSDRQGATVKEAVIKIGSWEKTVTNQIAIVYDGPALEVFATYEANLWVRDDAGQVAEGSLCFETGRMDTPWQAKWITDGQYHFTEKKVSPKPMTFRKSFDIKGPVKSAKIYSTAMGIYKLQLAGQKIGEDFFAPGFTSYKSHLQYQVYDVTDMLKDTNELICIVAGGWAVGSFVFTRKNRVSADRQALLLELHIDYMDGGHQVIATDDNWDVTLDGPYRMADFYDGETYDASFSFDSMVFHKAALEKLRVYPDIYATTGDMVRAHERLSPIECVKTSEGLRYDFGQNFAGVVALTITGKRGQTITVRHAEILGPDGRLNTDFLRSAKATICYTCADGRQTYMPEFTYMGFRYICIEGIDQDSIEVAAYALYSDIAQTGSFIASDARLTRLQENISWGAKSNFVDIPTDCPQRDERMGWTGDIAVFAPTACCNFDMKRFLNKWLNDVRVEQLPTGGIPNTVPACGYGFPATMPVMAVDFWGDAAVLVPWAMYQAYGDVSVLQDNYDMMKKYVNACRFWASLLSLRDHRYLWNTPSVLHFGDWIAPDVPKMSQWQGRAKWTATASLCHTSQLLKKVADILGKTEDAKVFAKLSAGAARAYSKYLTDGKGHVAGDFQTGYVLPLYFGMFEGQAKKAALANLVDLVEKNNYCIGTGFPGTPYILFALADNGRADVAYRMLFNEKCPSWLYEVKQGATTIWERWDGLDENGNCPIGDDGTDTMISYNHYASGAVGDFFYRRIAGIEMTEAGYKTFKIAPVVDKAYLTSARASLECPFGRITSDWHIDGEQFFIEIDVPVGSSCQLILPDSSQELFTSGHYKRQCPI